MLDALPAANCQLYRQAGMGFAEGFCSIWLASMSLRYQGLENDVVIVSLVRSNATNKLGFLKDDGGKRRMCVAQSRARCGLYFIGNADCFSTAPHWKQLLDMLRERGQLGNGFPQRCVRHPGVRKDALEADDLGCKEMCGQPFGCGFPEHLCRLPCHPEDGSHGAESCRCTIAAVGKCDKDPPHVLIVPCIHRAEISDQMPCPNCSRCGGDDGSGSDCAFLRCLEHAALCWNCRCSFPACIA